MAEGEEVCLTRSAAETGRLGERLARLLKPGEVIGLCGDLGSGKTCLAQGICRGLGVKDYVTSPTFILINEYPGRLGGQEVMVYHFDLYRLRGVEELEALGAEEYFYGSGICLVEWAERAGGLLPARRWEVVLEYAMENERRIVVRRLGPAEGVAGGLC